MKTVTMTVTPKWASEKIAKNPNPDSNRKLSESLVQLYAEDISNDRWALTHEGPAFDPSGEILDGNHFLHAVVKAGKPVKSRVSFDVPKSAMQFMNLGKSRTVMDIAHIAGNSWVKADHSAILFSMLCGPANRVARFTKAQTLELLDLYKDAVSFASDNFKGHLKGLGLAGTKGVIARAYYSDDHSKLQEFCSLLQNGIFDPKQRSHFTVKDLRDYLLTHTGQGASWRGEVYRRTQNVLKSFLAGEKKRNARDCKLDLFPLKNLHTYDLKFQGDS